MYNSNIYKFRSLWIYDKKMPLDQIFVFLFILQLHKNCHENCWHDYSLQKNIILKLFSLYFCSFQSDTSIQLEFVHFEIVVYGFTRAMFVYSNSLSFTHSLTHSLDFFLLPFGSQWQHNKCVYAKTIFPTHQTDIPL